MEEDCGAGTEAAVEIAIGYLCKISLGLLEGHVVDVDCSGTEDLPFYVLSVSTLVNISIFCFSNGFVYTLLNRVNKLRTEPPCLIQNPHKAIQACAFTCLSSVLTKERLAMSSEDLYMHRFCANAKLRQLSRSLLHFFLSFCLAPSFHLST